MTILFNIFLVVFFVLLNAFFVVAEFSMVKVRRSQISMLAADGRPAAALVLQPGDIPAGKSRRGDTAYRAGPIHAAV